MDKSIGSWSRSVTTSKVVVVSGNLVVVTVVEFSLSRPGFGLSSVIIVSTLTSTSKSTFDTVFPLVRGDDDSSSSRHITCP